MQYSLVEDAIDKNLLPPLSTLKVEEPGPASKTSAPLYYNTRRHAS